ncbi:MAG: Asp-tRNA(Asn)/Glu-tRNA(Gln) amidotransferase subunit GatA, partial [Leptospiraceae bacterium]|nr:Asp-tRNA(Asn)/Glu-tRNA(Gln) amidotransferase subunit GatA [Leptospiraceae bacterium]
ALNAFLHLDRDSILAQARASDERRRNGQGRGVLDGIPVSIKDNISVNGDPLGSASRILDGYVAPYDADVIERLRKAGAVLFGRTNMDEFAMGSTTENSSVQVTLNPWDARHVPGGSSGGAAVSVAAGITPLALGSDTGGSIRQPAAFCGVVGLKPTYGRVSRYGLAAYASSLDQIGPLARSVTDCALLLKAISGHDRRDSNSLADTAGPALEDQVADLGDDFHGLRVGVILPESADATYEPAVTAAIETAVSWLEGHGAEVRRLHSEYEEYIIPSYYILATAEASSNLGRYDGVRYGRRSPAADGAALQDLYVKSRTEGFGAEVKRRILLGTFVLSSGYYDAYYKTALKVRHLITREYKAFFDSCDVILQATSPVTAFRLGEKLEDPVAMYQSDILTIGANLAGLPAISVPAGCNEAGMPIGLQLLAGPLQENRLLEVARALAEIESFQMQYPGSSDPAIGAAGPGGRRVALTKPPIKQVVNQLNKPKKKKVISKVKKKAAKKTAKKATKKAAKKTAKKTAKKAAKKAGKKKASKKKAGK